MPTPPPGFVQFSIEHWLANYPRPAINVWGCKLGSYNGTSPVAIANHLQSIYTDAFGSGIDSSVTVRSTRVEIGQDGGDPLVGVSTTSFVGPVTRESNPPSLALMLDLNTGLGGRRNRGRKYLPWNVSDTSISETGAVAGTVITARNAEGADFLNRLLAIDSDLVILHGPGISPAGAPTPVTSITANPVIRTQKQRQVRF